MAALPYPDRKRVALARALVADPALLLLDEPAGGLGADDIAALADTVRGVAAAGTAVLLVEHHVDFVMALAQRVVVLDFGRVIAHGIPDEVRRDPRVEEAARALAASVPDGLVPEGTDVGEADGFLRALYADFAPAQAEAFRRMLRIVTEGRS